LLAIAMLHNVATFNSDLVLSVECCSVSVDPKGHIAVCFQTLNAKAL